MPISMSRKQKLNTRSSTEAELVDADDMSTMVLWTKLFMEAQGVEIKKNILYQDNIIECIYHSVWSYGASVHLVDP